MIYLRYQRNQRFQRKFTLYAKTKEERLCSTPITQPAPIAVQTLTPAKGATARVHPPAGIRPKIVPVRKPDRYGNRTGAKSAPMQKVHRCRLCDPTCPACRRSCFAAASSSLTPARLNRVQNDPRQFAGGTSCILQPVAFCNCCSTTKRKPLTLLEQRGRQKM